MGFNTEKRKSTAKVRGTALKRVRMLNGLTAEKLIEKSKGLFPDFLYSAAAVYAYESGRILLSEKVAAVFARALGVDVSVLLVESSSTYDLNVTAPLSISSHLGISTQASVQSWQIVYDQKRDRLVISTQSGNLANLHINLAGSSLKITPDLRNGNRGYVNGFREIVKRAIESGEDYPFFITVEEGLTAKELQSLLRDDSQRDQQGGEVRNVLLGGGRRPVVLGVG